MRGRYAKPPPPPNPSGLCQCGCGRLTPIAKQSNARWGHLRDHPVRFLRGHHHRVGLAPEYIEDPETGCWVWQRSTRGTGYGQAGVADGSNRQVPAHRLVYERHRGPIPPGLVLDHLCRNRLCVNPDHLEPVTNRENISRGKRSDHVRPHINAIRRSTLSAEELARRLGVSNDTVLRIRKGERHWRETNL